MNMKVLIILLIGLVTLVGIGFFMTANETNVNNFRSITLADGTTLGIPADFKVTNPFSNYTESDGFYHTNCDLESKDYGWIHIEYTHDPVETMTHGSNSTEATSNNGVYEYDVFDANGHCVMRITGSNPAVVKAIGETVKFNTNQPVNTTNHTNMTNNTVVEHVNHEDTSSHEATSASKSGSNSQDGLEATLAEGRANMPAEVRARYDAREEAFARGEYRQSDYTNC